MTRLTQGAGSVGAAAAGGSTFVLDGCPSAPGGRMTYFMTGPDGDKHAGYWQITAVDEPTSFSFVDGFADLDFNPNPEMPVSKNVYTFAERDGGTRAVFTSTFESAEALQQVLDMGVVEGASSAINQIDDLVAS